MLKAKWRTLKERTYLEPWQKVIFKVCIFILTEILAKNSHVAPGTTLTVLCGLSHSLPPSNSVRSAFLRSLLHRLGRRGSGWISDLQNTMSPACCTARIPIQAICFQVCAPYLTRSSSSCRALNTD